MLCPAPAAAGDRLYVSLFTEAEASSLTALRQGLGRSVGFGALAGAPGALFHNMFAFFGPR